MKVVKEFGYSLKKIISKTIIFLCLILFFVKGSHSTQTLRYGQSFPPIRGNDINTGKEFVIEKGKWSLVFYTSTPVSENLSFLKYLDILFQKLKFRNINFLGIIENQTRFYELSQIHYPIIIDKNFSIGKKLKLKKGQIASFLIDTELKIKFACYFPIKEEDLRMILEENLFGFITQFKKPDNLSILNKPFPAISVKNIKSNNTIKFNDAIKNCYLIVFGPECTRCELKKYSKSLLKFERFLNSIPIVVLFSYKFSELDILNYLKNAKLDLFLSTDEIHELEDLYYSKSYFDHEVIVIHVENGIIKNIIEFEKFEKYFQEEF
jgi:hypothetical protein